MSPELATLAAAGWRVEEAVDERGYPVWRATKDGWLRGAHRLAALVEDCQRADAARATMKPIMRYPGSKSTLAPWIVSHMPRTPYYIDLFCGSGAVWFALWEGPNRPRYAVLNDLDGDIVNLFRVLRDPLARKRLIDGVALTPWSRVEYELHRDAPQKTAHPDAVERARLYLVQLWQGHGSGAGGRSAVGWRHQGPKGMRSGVHTWQGWGQMPERLAAAAQALLSAEIECRPARMLLREYAANDVLIYADPPYLGSVRNGTLYRHEMRSVLAHARLLRDLRRHPGPALISGYPHRMYDHMLPGWRRVTKTSQAEKGKIRTEVLWVNPTAQKHLGLGPLFDLDQEDA